MTAYARKIKLGSGSEYAYLYGRVCGMHGKLFSPREIESFIQATSVSEILASLSNTDYAPELEDLSTKPTPRELENALTKHFNRVYENILSVAPSEDQSALHTIFLGEYDINNIKTVVRGIHFSLRDEAANLLQPFGMIGFERMRESSKSQDFDALLPKIPEPYHNITAQAFGVYAKNHSLPLLDASLDKGWVAHMLWSVRGDMLYYVKLKADSMNIINLLRCKLHEVPAADYVLPGGMFLDDHLDALILCDLNAVQSMLDKTPYGRHINKHIPNIVRADSLIALEQSLKDFIQTKLDEKSMMAPLSASPLLSFLNRKMREVNNLKVIIVAKQNGFQPDEIKQLVGR